MKITYEEEPGIWTTVDSETDGLFLYLFTSACMHFANKHKKKTRKVPPPGAL